VSLLHVVDIQVPPLCERISDIPFLVESFIRELNKREGRAVTHLQNDALHALLDLRWPGNIRELRNVIEHAFAVSSGSVLKLEHLPARILQMDDQPESATDHSKSAKTEKEVIMQALEQAGFNKGRTAALLGISPATLYRKRKKYGI
jgi:DNA-binding NtrC family response regulator